MKPKIKIGIVGPCAAGKSTLIAGLKERGYEARHIAQEHSYVPDMWRRITNPNLLIYLDVSYPVSIERRKLNWSLDEYNIQIQRLNHARQNTDFYLQTDNYSIEEVLQRVTEYLLSVENI